MSFNACGQGLRTNHETRFTKLTVAFGVLVMVAQAALAQSGTVQTSGATAATTVPPPSPAESLPRPDFRFKGQVGRTYEDSDPPTFPQVVPAKRGAERLGDSARRCGLWPVQHIRWRRAVAKYR
jgi:hypothetical protein